MSIIRQIINYFLFNHIVVKFTGTRPRQGYWNDAGYDVYCSENVIIPPYCCHNVPTDLRIEMPDDIWCEIRGRSSALEVRGLQCQSGVIDAGYRGSLHISVYNSTNKNIMINCGDRVAQLIFYPRLGVTFKKVKKLSPSERNNRGFGSTGL